MAQRKRKLENRNPAGSSVYPLHPSGSRIIFRIPEGELTALDRIAVASSSLFVVGSVVWVPLLYTWAWRKWKSIPATDKKRRAIYAGFVLACTALFTFGPHRSPRFGKWLRVRKWKLWSAWLKFIAMEVISDQKNDNKLDMQRDQAMLAFVPHGIFPFAFAFGALPEMSQKAFGLFRPVVATATNFFPLVNDFISWLGKIDASRSAVDLALSKGNRVGIVPGGIAEIFEGYPKAGSHPNEEYSIVRKGFLRLALRHGVPVIPIYCFGATKMFRRLQLPALEHLSLLLRVSIVVFFGSWGLPVPFRQRLMYVIGNPIAPPSLDISGEEQAVDKMYNQFCDELLRIFDRHKESYGWGQKTLKLIPR